MFIRGDDKLREKKCEEFRFFQICACVILVRERDFVPRLNWLKFFPLLIMAVALRLNRQGTKNRPYYKIVAVDSRKRRDGRYIEQVGTYDPMVEGANYTIDLEKADKWLSVGAKPSETVNSIIRKARTAASK